VARTDAIVFTPSIDGGIVVGHDGSEHGDRALLWALEDALRRGGSPVHLVRAWQLAMVMSSIRTEPGVVPSYAECEVAIREKNHAAIQRTHAAAGAERFAGIEVHEHAVHAPSAEVLIKASEHADLVVVGDRGRGGFAGMLLGSTAGHVLRHAHCPVVVVRGRSSG
jgi:nucleotide-binding universal stress UspA family protein